MLWSSPGIDHQEATIRNSPAQPKGRGRGERIQEGQDRSKADGSAHGDQEVWGLLRMKDDMLVYGDGERHDQGLREILWRFSAAGLMPKEDEGELGKKEVKWLGQLRWMAGRRTDADKIQGARNRPRAETTKKGKSLGQTDPHKPRPTGAERIEPPGRA